MLVGSLVRSLDLSMTSGTSLFLLEACPTCHRMCMMLVLHLSRRVSSHVGPWIHVITSLVNERREPWDPRVEIVFGDLDMDRGSLQWLIGSLGRSPDLHMGLNQPIFCRWLLEALFIMMACVDGLVGPSRGRPSSRWSLQPPNSHVLCNYKQIMTCTCGTTLFAPK